MLQIVFLILLLKLACLSQASTTISWASQPILPGETVLLGGSGFVPGSSVKIKSLDNPALTWSVAASDVSSSALKFRLPAHTLAKKYGRYLISVDGGAPFSINTPDTWWWQGDQGSKSTPGGWLRVFGRSIGVSGGSVAASAAAESDSRAQADIAAAVSAGRFNDARNLLAALEEAHRIRQLQNAKAETVAEGTWLQLHSAKGGAPVLLQSVVANTSEWHALFKIPQNLAAAEYTAKITNSFNGSNTLWTSMEMFVSPEEPARTVVSVIDPAPWKQDVFTVDCKLDLSVFQRPCGWVGVRSQKEINAAIAAARANGGGIVLLPRGQYYVDGPIVIPDGVHLRGESTELVSIYFREDNPQTAPKPGYVYSDGSKGSRWAVTDITIYISHYYHSVIYVGTNCSDFTLSKVRVRAVAYAMLGETCKGANGRGHRLADYSVTDIGEVVYLAGNDNYKIVDCDLLGTNIIIHTGVNPGSGPSATNGIVARNILWNGNAAHWFDDIKQVIFEHNTIRPGGVGMTWGNNIDNYGDGYCQHVYHAENNFQHAWAGDREYMTFDPINGHYFGPTSVDATGVILTLVGGKGEASNSSLGGAISVLAGAGAGQYRRIVAMPDKSHVVIDKPFTSPLDSTSLVQLGPFKGKMIFHGNSYTDGGSFQTYGNAQDVVVSGTRFERTEALLSWGRSYSNQETNCPNIHVQFLDNVVVEGNHLWNYNGSYPYPHPKTVEPYFIGILGSDQDSQPCEPYPHGNPGPCPPSPPEPFQGAINHLVTLQRNIIMNNGGIVVRGHTDNVLVEGNTILKSHVGIHVNSTHASHVLVDRNNVADQGSEPTQLSHLWI